jgi:hypothetical protein
MLFGGDKFRRGKAERKRVPSIGFARFVHLLGYYVHLAAHILAQTEPNNFQFLPLYYYRRKNDFAHVYIFALAYIYRRVMCKNRKVREGRKRGSRH